MNRKEHLIGSIAIAMLVHLIVSMYHVGDAFPNPNLAALFGGALGGLFPDWDILILGEGRHRNTFFHSSIPQTLIFISYLFDGTYTWATYFFMFFYIGTSVHLLMDLIPGNVDDAHENSFRDRWSFRIDKMRRGVVGGKIVGPPFDISKKRRWLIWNAVLLMLFAVINYVVLLTGFYIPAPW